ITNMYNHYRYGQNKVEPYKPNDLEPVKAGPFKDYLKQASSLPAQAGLPNFEKTVSSINYGQKYQNAYWDGDTMVFGSGNAINLNAKVRDWDLSLSTLSQFTTRYRPLPPIFPLSLLNDDTEQKLENKDR
ncbi:MAG: hypothetical protein K2X81_05680, partial [Candidatus Obscuribacterales bacterium]|nr:hypothetical protein [Candidatus Obscuribacterales bacterium]